MVKCSIKTTTAVLERNREMFNSLDGNVKSGNIRQEGRQLLECKTSNISENNNIGERDDFEKTKLEFDRLNSNLLKSLEIHRSVQSFLPVL